MKHIIATDNAPRAIGAYSQGAVFSGRLLFTAGQLGLDPATGDFVPGGVAEQTEQAMKNLKAIVEAGGAKMEDILKVTIFMVDMGDFAVINGVYAKFFDKNPPARSAVAVKALPKGGLVEIECIATVG